MWKCLKLLGFSIQTTEKLFIMPNVTFDSNHGNLGAPDTATDSQPAGSWYICQIGSLAGSLGLSCIRRKQRH